MVIYIGICEEDMPLGGMCVNKVGIKTKRAQSK